MRYNFGKAIDAIMHKDWWFWCLLIIPYAYFSIHVNNNPKNFFVPTYLIAGIAAFFLYPAFLGFILKYAKAYAYNLDKDSIEFNFGSFWVLGFKYYIFQILLFLIVYIAFIPITLAVLIFIPFAQMVSPLWLIILGIVGIIFTIKLAVKFFLNTLVAPIRFIKDNDMSVAFKINENNMLFNRNSSAFMKLIGWLIVAGLLLLILALLMSIVSTISQIFIILGNAFITYAGAMIGINLQAQTLQHILPQLDPDYAQQNEIQDINQNNSASPYQQ